MSKNKNPQTSPLVNFAEQVIAMRESQKTYFAVRTQENLGAAKKLEREVDRRAAEIVAGPQMFDE